MNDNESALLRSNRESLGMKIDKIRRCCNVQMDQFTVSIIGTAGRKEAGKILTPQLFSKMVSRAAEIIESLNISPDKTLLVSGGAVP